MRKLLAKLLGDQNAKKIKKLRPKLEAINALEPKLKKLTDAGLKKQTDKLKDELKKGKKLDEILPEAFATTREAARRTLGQRHFDVQLLGGMVLHEGNIAEMRTGEGKTLVATLPVYLNALSGNGVHVITVNDYLAQRDAGWMSQIYHFLGLSVGVIIGGNKALLYDPKYKNPEHDDERLMHLRPVEKREAYAADITYGTNNEFGFDYLRDNMAPSLEEYVQRPLNFAIVDEVDSILIDEARTPLIISAPASENATNYKHFAAVAKQLKKETDYAVDEKVRSATLTDDGVEKVEKILGVKNLYDTEHIQKIYHIEQSLRAEALFKKDKDYVVRGGEVIIVDEFTGRLLPGRRYSEGLHQAIEAKESVEILQESQTLATISFQNYFRLYNKLAGMTGTAETESEEFDTVYDLEVVVIPTNQPMVRDDRPDRIYKTAEAKYKAIAEDVKERHATGQPVLIGTVSIERNELLSSILNKLKVPHEILNAKNNESEAAIIARAGQKGAVTLATNIAGRGTDIVLGEGVKEVGGLHVLGSERHEARRIDNQLRGRAGRQGDPGSTQFYVSLDDELMRVFGGDKIASLMNTLRVDEDTPIENRFVSKALESAQKRVESHNFDIRKQVLQYDDVMNRHRESIYKRRRKVLKRGNLSQEVKEMIKREVDGIIDAHINQTTDELDHKKALELIRAFMPLDAKFVKNLKEKNVEEVPDELHKEIEKIYKNREKAYGTEMVRDMERVVYLQSVDRLWMEHLETMEHLREGIRLRAIGQRNPLVEYKKEAFNLFNILNASIDHEVATSIFRMAPVQLPSSAEVPTELTTAAENALIEGPSESGGLIISQEPEQPASLKADKKTKVGRNDQCPCGSGLKYKRCGLINSKEHQVNTKGQENT